MYNGRVRTAEVNGRCNGGGELCDWADFEAAASASVPTADDCRLADAPSPSPPELPSRLGAWAGGAGVGVLATLVLMGCGMLLGRRFCRGRKPTAAVQLVDANGQSSTPVPGEAQAL